MRKAPTLRSASHIHAPHIRYEKLGEGYMKLHDIVKTDLKIPHVFKTEKKGVYQDYYNDHSRELVAKYFALDIERWNYTF